MRTITEDYQTDMLREMGFDEPRTFIGDEWHDKDDNLYAYDLNQLLSFLPTYFYDSYDDLYTLCISTDEHSVWTIQYTSSQDVIEVYAYELVDAIVKMLNELNQNNLIKITVEWKKK